MALPIEDIDRVARPRPDHPQQMVRLRTPENRAALVEEAPRRLQQELGHRNTFRLPKAES
jgi:hypothetical protein